MNRWSLTVLLVFAVVELVGFSWLCTDGNLYSLQGAIAFLLLMYAVSFIVLFGLDVISCEFSLAFNPYVYEVEEMDWLFNPMYFVWLYATDLRKWATATTVINFPFSVMFGIIISSFLMDFKKIPFQDLWVDIIAGMALLAFMLFCVYEGVYKEL